MTPIFFSIIIPVSSDELETLATLEQLVTQPGEFETFLVHRSRLSENFTEAVRRLELTPQSQPEKVPTPPAEGTTSVQFVSTPEVSRGAMLNAAAKAAKGNVLFFLWPGTRLPDQALLKVENNFKLLPQTIGGNFHLKFDYPHFITNWLAGRLKKWRYAGLYFGNSGLFVKQNVFDSLGGFKDLDLLEDLDFARRLEEFGATLFLPDYAVCSATRFRRRPLGTIVGWGLIYILYNLGVSPNTLAKFYPD